MPKIIETKKAVTTKAVTTVAKAGIAVKEGAKLLQRPGDRVQLLYMHLPPGKLFIPTETKGGMPGNGPLGPPTPPKRANPFKLAFTVNWPHGDLDMEVAVRFVPKVQR